jgi:hypothetical protein
MAQSHSRRKSALDDSGASSILVLKSLTPSTNRPSPFGREICEVDDSNRGCKVQLAHHETSLSMVKISGHKTTAVRCSMFRFVEVLEKHF